MMASGKSGDWCHDELTESTLEGLFLSELVHALREASKYLPPKLVNHLCPGTPHLRRNLAKRLRVKKPTGGAFRSESNGSLWGNLKVAKKFVVVSGNNDIDGLDGTTKAWYTSAGN
jgi:hypothetical protein